MTAATPQATFRTERRELATTILCGMVALTIYGALAPTRVHPVVLPMTGNAPDSFEPVDWGLLLGAFVAGVAAAYVVTLIVERRMPRRPRRRQNSQPVDRTVFAGILLGPFASILYARPTHGLIAFNERSGAFVWAPPDLASYGIWMLALLGVGMSTAWIVQTVHLRRRGVARPAAVPG